MNVDKSKNLGKGTMADTLHGDGINNFNEESVNATQHQKNSYGSSVPLNANNKNKSSVAADQKSEDAVPNVSDKDGNASGAPGNGAKRVERHESSVADTGDTGETPRVERVHGEDTLSDFRPFVELCNNKHASEQGIYESLRVALYIFERFYDLDRVGAKELRVTANDRMDPVASFLTCARFEACARGSYDFDPPADLSKDDVEIIFKVVCVVVENYFKSRTDGVHRKCPIYSLAFLFMKRVYLSSCKFRGVAQEWQRLLALGLENLDIAQGSRFVSTAVSILLDVVGVRINANGRIICSRPRKFAMDILTILISYDATPCRYMSSNGMYVFAACLDVMQVAQCRKVLLFANYYLKSFKYRELDNLQKIDLSNKPFGSSKEVESILILGDFKQSDENQNIYIFGNGTERPGDRLIGALQRFVEKWERHERMKAEMERNGTDVSSLSILRDDSNSCGRMPLQRLTRDANGQYR